jgi:hypothetical protein
MYIVTGGSTATSVSSIGLTGRDITVLTLRGEEEDHSELVVVDTA